MSDTANKTVIYCHCGYYQLVPDAKKTELLDLLSKSSVKLHAVNDLCYLAARKSPLLKKWSACKDLTIIACYARSIKWLFRFAGACLFDESTTVINARTTEPNKIISMVTDSKSVSTSHREVKLEKTDGWVPWFPVIDYDRCQNCAQCMNFCLFGVYALSPGGKVVVEKPENCKTNCPACARMCPQTAIIFPKYDKSPINGDIPEQTEQATKSPPVDIKGLLKGDIQQMLRNRSLHSELDIPRDVLEKLSASQRRSLQNRKSNSSKQDSVNDS